MAFLVGVLCCVGLFVGLLVLTEKGRVLGNCSACGGRTALRNGIGTCEHCGEALQALNGAFVPAPSGFIHDRTVFVTDLGRTNAPELWKQVWSGRCCVCGGTSSREDLVNIKSIVGQIGPLLFPQNLTRSHRYAVGYCNAHRNGFHFFYPPGRFHFFYPPGIGYAKKNAQCRLAVRSVDYYRAFMNQNARAGAMRQEQT